MTKGNNNNILALLAEKAAEATDLRLLIQSIITETINYMEAASGSIMVYDSDEDCLKLYVSSSHPSLSKDMTSDSIKKIPLKDSISAQVFKSGKPLINNKSTNVKLSRKNDSGSYLSVPLIINKKHIGVMNLNRLPEQKNFEDKDLERLSGINAFIAGLIDKEDLLERIEENRKEISALFNMSSLLSETNDFAGRLEEFLRLLSEELGMKRSAIVKAKCFNSKDDKTATKSKERKIEIIASHQLKKNQLEEMFDSVTERIKQRLLSVSPLYNGDEDQPLTLLFDDNNETCEMYCIPLYVEDICPYFLIVSRIFSRGNESQVKKHYRFLQIISNNISNALTREKMLRTIQQDQQIQKANAEKNKIFFEISKDLGSTLDPYTILQKSFDQFNKIISFTTISILLYDDLDSRYKLIIQPAEPISLKYQNNLTKSIYELYSDYPTNPALSEENLSKPTIFNPHNQDVKPVANFKNVLHLPIILGSSVKGLIHLARKTNEGFSAEELDTTSQFTGIFLTSIKNAMIHKRTEKLAFTDPLTELYNHRFFQETLQQEFTRASRYKKSLSLMILDIDFFKKFNDTYGHLVGDKVLKHVSAIFKSSIREQIDTVARYGGEEFAVILPETSLDGASIFAERIRSKVEQSVLEEGEMSLKVTISIGVACASVTKCEKTSDLIEAADQALYQAKLNGRNQFQTYKDSTVSYEKKH